MYCYHRSIHLHELQPTQSSSNAPETYSHLLCTTSDSSCHKTGEKRYGVLVFNLFWRQCSPIAKSPPAAPGKILCFLFHAPSWEPTASNPFAVSSSSPKMIICTDRHCKQVPPLVRSQSVQMHLLDPHTGLQHMQAGVQGMPTISRHSIICLLLPLTS